MYNCLVYCLPAPADGQSGLERRARLLVVEGQKMRSCSGEEFFEDIGVLRRQRLWRLLRKKNPLEDDTNPALNG